MALKKQSVTVLWNCAAGWDAGEKEAREVEAILSEDASKVDFRRVYKGEDIINWSARQLF